MYNYILFDADNTLLDFDAAQFHSFSNVLHHYGIDFTETIYEKYLIINHALWHQFEKGVLSKESVQSQRFKILFDSLGYVIDGMDAERIYQLSLQNQCWLMPYAGEVCKILYASTNLSIVTNGVGPTQIARIQNSEIGKYMSFLVISEEVGYAKPDPRFFAEAFKIIGCTQDDHILIVGDSLTSDIQGGINAGIDTCWYSPNMQVFDSDIKINYIIHDLRELLSIVFN